MGRKREGKDKEAGIKATMAEAGKLRTALKSKQVVLPQKMQERLVSLCAEGMAGPSPA